MTLDDAKPTKTSLQRRRQKSKRKARGALAQQASKEAKKATQDKKRRRSAGAPSFAALPGAPILVPDGLKEGRGLQVVRSASKPRSGPAAPKPVMLEVDRFIAMISTRSMLELRQQWLNVLRLRSSGTRMKGLGRFQEALTNEWERRHRLALADPDHFEWPSTEALGGDGNLAGSTWHAEGVLGFLGYRVGLTQGIHECARRHVLDLVFGSPLPPINGPAYMREWHTPGSSVRLRKLAETIASFTRNAKRKRSATMDSAIADWERDLNYLYRTYYVGKFAFAWPRLSV